MPDRFNRSLAEIAIRTLLPAACGAIGALVMAIAPVYHTAFCAGGI